MVAPLWRGFLFATNAAMKYALESSQGWSVAILLAYCQQ